MELKRFISEFSSNSYLLINGQSGIVIDAGGCAQDISALADEKNAVIEAVFLTHAHYDHLADINTYMRMNIPVYIHKDEAEWLHLSSKNLSVAFGAEFDAEKNADVKLNDGDKLNIGGMEISIIHTPGHSPGSICLHIDNMLFTGDTLFSGSIGRYDLPGSDGVLIRKSLKEKLMILDDDLTIYPGHGTDSSIGLEKRQNPFLT